MDGLHRTTQHPGQQRQLAAPRTRPLPTATTARGTTPAPHTDHPHAPEACLSRVRGQPARTVLRRRWTQQCVHRYPTITAGLKARLRPMRGLKRLRSARVICAGHAFVQNLRCGHYELGLDVDRGIGSPSPSPNSPSPSDHNIHRGRPRPCPANATPSVNASARQFEE
jgi:hypothetical protein